MKFFKVIESPLGDLTIVSSDIGLCELIFGDEKEHHQSSKKKSKPIRDNGDIERMNQNRSIQIHLSNKNRSIPDLEENREDRNHPILITCERQLDEYFGGKRKVFEVPLDLKGTDFQKRVWKELQKIPYGKIISYGQQAAAIGHKKAVRAVAAANGRNPVGIIVPCHRVIASTGHLHGYAGGLGLKRKLLKLEGLEITNDDHIDRGF